MTVHRRRVALIASSLVLTFVVLRASLYLSPNSNLDIGPYNIHHLFTGLLLIVAAGIPLVVVDGHTRMHDASTLAFGAGLGLALDEWVYLIATDGSDAAYLLPVSFWGGAIMVGLAALYTLAWLWPARQKSTEKTGNGRAPGQDTQ